MLNSQFSILLRKGKKARCTCGFRSSSDQNRALGIEHWSDHCLIQVTRYCQVFLRDPLAHGAAGERGWINFGSKIPHCRIGTTGKSPLLRLSFFELAPTTETS